MAGIHWFRRLTFNIKKRKIIVGKFSDQRVILNQTIMEKKLLSILVLSVFFTVTALPFNGLQKNNPVGHWKFSVTASPDPYYSTGTLYISFAENKYSASILFSRSNYEIMGEKVKFENNTLTFTTYIQGEQVVVTGKMTGPDKIDGKAVYSQGEVKVTLTKEPAGK
ncbi:MAG: hypothetical protein ACOXZV_11950 [Bacteroidales bacterium]|jgi:hypothetical protein